MEPVEPGYSIFKGKTPEPKIVYELPDGTTTIWLSEYIDAMVQAEQDRIIQILVDNSNGDYQKVMLTPKLLKLIKEER
jgi:hypothetical protein